MRAVSTAYTWHSTLYARCRDVKSERLKSRAAGWQATDQVSKQQGQSCLHSHLHQLWTQNLLWIVPNPSKPRIIHVVVLLLIMHFTGREPADNPFMLASTLSTHCTPRYSSIREGQIMYRSDIHMTDAFRWSWLWRETPSPQGESPHVKWLWSTKVSS